MVVGHHWKAVDNGASEYTNNLWYENSFARSPSMEITRLFTTYLFHFGQWGLVRFFRSRTLEVMGRVFAKEIELKYKYLSN